MVVICLNLDALYERVVFKCAYLYNGNTILHLSHAPMTKTNTCFNKKLKLSDKFHFVVQKSGRGVIRLFWV